MPITYNPDTNTITVVGTKDGQPYTFEDIYQADQANGWNKFLKLSEGVYKTTAKLQFGDGTTETLFEEKETSLVIENIATKDNDTIVLFKANCTAKFGEILEVNGDNIYYCGVTLILRETTYIDAQILIEDGSNVEFYNCKFTTTADSKRTKIFGYNFKLIGCVVDILLTSPRYSEIKHTMVMGRYGHITSPIDTTMDNITFLTYNIYALWLSNTNTVISNSFIVARTRIIHASHLQSPHVAKLVNCKAFKWEVNWILDSGEVSGEIQRLYTVRFKVTDVNGNPLSGRTVKVYDKNGNKIAEAQTDSNGLTPEVEILYAKLTNPYSDGTWHTFTDEDWEYLNPYVVEVWYGSELEYKGILTDLDVESTYVQITVKPSSLTLTDVINEIKDVKKEIRKHDVKITALKFI